MLYLKQMFQNFHNVFWSQTRIGNEETRLPYSLSLSNSKDFQSKLCMNHVKSQHVECFNIDGLY